MALKDLTTSARQLSEAQIEELVTPYARYDPEAGVVVLLPQAARLQTRHRVLVYLAALQGWPYVTDKALPTSATPADLSQALHIPGGTLRPLLKSLKEAHLVRSSGTKYSVVTGAIEAIRAETAHLHAAKPETKAASAQGPRTRPKAGTTDSRGARKGKRHGGESSAFLGWVKNGFFRQPKTFREILDEFHRAGRMIKSTSLPGYLLEAVRAGVLVRNKKDVDGKRVWLYQAPSRSGNDAS